jgi:carboxymethylenebutenolidase
MTTPIQESTVHFTGHNGSDVTAHVAAPSTSKPTPAVVITHGATGISEDTKRSAAILANAGFLVAIPYLYSRTPNADLSSLENAMKVLSTISDMQAAGDLEGCAKHIAGLPSCNGKVAGMGLGGRYASVFGMYTSTLSAVVSTCGPLGKAPIDTPELRPRTPMEMTKRIDVPFLGIYGGADANPSPAEVAELEQALRQLGKRYTINVYPGVGHNFMDTRGRNYNAEQAERAWRDIIAWLKAALGSE